MSDLIYGLRGVVEEPASCGSDEGVVCWGVLSGAKGLRPFDFQGLMTLSRSGAPDERLGLILSQSLRRIADDIMAASKGGAFSADDAAIVKRILSTPHMQGKWLDDQAILESLRALVARAEVSPRLARRGMAP